MFVWCQVALLLTTARHTLILSQKRTTIRTWHRNVEGLCTACHTHHFKQKFLTHISIVIANGQVMGSASSQTSKRNLISFFIGAEHKFKGTDFQPIFIVAFVCDFQNPPSAPLRRKAVSFVRVVSYQVQGDADENKH